MKLSRKFLSDYIDTSDIEINKLALDMTSIGNEFDLSKLRYDKIIIMTY